ncbi:hypothetical protein MHU86_25173 [Fragilaria crotonensis]|nr:hypothetical protein MHU86_25173 [Fragilaria crotonensis]
MVVVVVENDAATEVMEEVSQSASPVSASPPTNYWGWKETVKGTLSNLDLSKLGKAKQETAVSPETLDTSSDSVPKVTPGGGYWEWTETIKKTLSTVSLGTVGHAHGVDAKNNDEAVKQSQKNYWHWRNSFKSASDLAQQEKDGGLAAGASAKSPTPTTGSYWFWRNPSMTSLSQVNLDQASKKEMEGDDSVASTPTKTGGPITNLEHRMRNSWRKSFQKLSNSSLTKLDEGGKDESKSSAWKESFRSFRESVQNLNGKQQHDDSVVQEVAFAAENDVRHDNNQMSLTKNDSQQSLGGITF